MLMYRTMNNWLCKEVVYNCLYGNYDIAVVLMSDNIDEFSHELYLNLFEFVWCRCDLKEYHDVLKRLRNKSVDEFKILHRLNNLILTFKRKGGVLK